MAALPAYCGCSPVTRKDDPAGDRDRVVGDALVVAAEQGDVDGRLDAVGPVGAQELAEGVAAQLVHLLVDLLELLGSGDVGLGDDVLDLGDHHLGDGGHPLDHRDHGGRHGDLGDAQPGDLGDVDGQVAHPLELADHPQRRDQHPQVAGDGVLQGEQLEAVLLELLAQRVDLGVAGDDLLGPLGVALEQRGRALGDRLADEAGHAHEVVADRVELVGVGIAHGPNLSRDG